MVGCEYAAGLVRLECGDKTYIIRDISTLDWLIQSVTRERDGRSSREDFDLFQGLLDLLASARRYLLQDLEVNNAQIPSGRSGHQGETGGPD